MRIARSEGMPGRKVTIVGDVHAIGFRPWVQRLARKAGLAGRIRVAEDRSFVSVFGSEGSISYFMRLLASDPPAGLSLRHISWESIPMEDAEDEITVSSQRLAVWPEDRGICDECRAAIDDPASPRFRDPFAMCAHCGPRHSLGANARNSSDEPGPSLILVDAGGLALAEGEAAMDAAVSALRTGHIAAVKGTGGFQLLCLASDGRAVSQLRERKHSQRPFAVLASGLPEARRIASLSEEEMELLESPERPIVICAKRPGGIGEHVAPGSTLGLSLPDSGLLHILVKAAGGALVTTSANRTGEPLVARNDDALARLRWIADVILLHDRPVFEPCEESVTRLVAHRPLLLRRGRGWVPRPVPVPTGFAGTVLALGAGERPVCCVANGSSAVLSAPDAEPLTCAERAEVIAHDLDPDDAGARWAREKAGVRTIPVQRHHAHVVATMAEHGLRGPVLGLAFDGGGRGPDGAWWGGELLFADEEEFRRVATFRPVRLAGGSRAIREPWRVALAILEDAFGQGVPEEIIRRLLPGIDGNEREAVRTMIEHGEGAPRSHSVARWLDAMAAIILRRGRCSYDGQLADECESIAAPMEIRAYPWTIDDGSVPWTIDLRPAVRVAVQELLRDRPAGIVAAKFQNTIAGAAIASVQLALAEIGRVDVVLSGSCFANRHLTETVIAGLADETTVHVPQQIPIGDGGMALGQAVVADARLRREREAVRAPGPSVTAA